MVALMGPAYQDTYVSEWSVSGSSSPTSSMMSGMEITLDEAPRIRFALDHPVKGSVIKLVRNGTVIKKVKGSSLDFVDEQTGSSREPSYYRVHVFGPQGSYTKKDDYPTHPASQVVVNPIFVRFK